MTAALASGHMETARRQQAALAAVDDAAPRCVDLKAKAQRIVRKAQEVWRGLV